MFSIYADGRNIFRDLAGTPLKDIGPDPVCMPDPDNDPDAGKSTINSYLDAAKSLIICLRCVFGAAIFRASTEPHFWSVEAENRNRFFMAAQALIFRD